MERLIAFIGFGEAASSMARDFQKTGVQDMAAYDVMADTNPRGEIIRARAKQYDVTLFPSAEEACRDAKYIITFTSPAFAVSVAESIIPLLKAGQRYVDVNSTSPAVMRKIADIPHEEGVGICDGAALGNVQKLGCKVPVVVCGTGAEDFKRDLTPYGMSIEVLDAPIGAASGMKMLKTVYSKGMQQLVLEYILAAQSCGILKEMVCSVHNPMEGKTLEEYANEAMPRMLIHAKRRAAEVANAVETVEGLGLEASMTQAAQHKFEQIAALNLADQIDNISDMNYQEIAELLLPYMQNIKE